MLPIRGGTFLLRHRRLLPLAVAPFLLNALLYAAAVFAFFQYYDDWFSLIMQRPEVWYWLGVYYVLRVLAFLMGVAVFVFSFVFVGTVLAAPFLDLLSERTEAIVQGRTSSGVASMGIQIAKMMGARVITTAGVDWKIEKAKELGADEVIERAT